MTADPASGNHDSHQTGRGKAARIATVGAILLLAFGVRVFYAHELPLSFDEVRHLRLAWEISLRPSSFNLPLGSDMTNHPLGVVYLTALGKWMGGGSVFVIRLVFIALSLFGLVGLYVLGSSMFTWRLALIALGLAAVDRSLVALSPVFLESPAVTFLAPWTMLLMYRCLTSGRARDWLLVGLLLGLGYCFSTLFLVLLLPFGLYILLAGMLGQVLKSRWTYAGLGVMLALMLPSVVWNLLHESINYVRNVDKVGFIGLSPRMALLYIGDLLICLKDPTWIVEQGGTQMYLPNYIPCDWVMGLLYIGFGALSLRFWRDQRIALLLVVIVGFLIPVTLIDAEEPWNEFTWASSTVFVAILLVAFVIDRMLPAKRGKVIVSVVLAYSVGALACFLAGPKWGYFCPEWERVYVGQMLALECRSSWNRRQFPRSPAVDRMRKLTDEVIDQHPKSVVAWYYRGHCAKTAAERARAFDRALQLDPDNSLVIQARKYDLIQQGHVAEARKLLNRINEPFPEDVSYRKAADDFARQGDYQRAEQAYRKALELNPKNATVHNNWGASLVRQGRLQEAKAHLLKAIELQPENAETHSNLGLVLHRQRNYQQALEHYRQSLEIDPEYVMGYIGLATVLVDLGKLEEAKKYLRAAERLDPGNPHAKRLLSDVLARQRKPD